MAAFHGNFSATWLTMCKYENRLRSGAGKQRSAACLLPFDPNEQTFPRKRPNFSEGRVEGGRGSLGSVARAPLPTPAHQTERANFQHSAFRSVFTRRPTKVGRSTHGVMVEFGSVEAS